MLALYGDPSAFGDVRSMFGSRKRSPKKMSADPSA
jgi:hypothetical protein